MGDKVAANTRHAASRRWGELVSWGALALAAFWFMGSFDDYVAHHDLIKQDDSGYLRLALDAHAPADLPAAMGTLYCLWLRVLHALAQDPIQTYYLAGYLSSLVVPLVWYPLARSFRVPPLWAGISAIAWLVSAVNLEAIQVGQFACVLLWLTAIASRAASTARVQWLIATCGVLLASFVRPEFFLAGPLVLGVAADQLRRRDRRSLGVLAVPLLLAVALIALFGLPMGGPRTAIAWHQHLAFWLNGGTTGATSWDNDFDESLIRRGLYTSGPLSFAMLHPLQMAKFLLSNFRELVFDRFWDTLAPTVELQQRSHELIWLPLASCFAAGVAWHYRNRDAQRPPTHWPSVAVLGLSAAMVLPLCLLLYPWPRYVAPLWAALLLLVSPREGQAGTHPARTALVILLIAATMPRLAAPGPAPPKPIETIVRILRERAGGVPIAIFDDFAHYSDYLEPPGVHVGPKAARSGFQAMLARDAPSAVVLTPRLDRALRDDPGYQAFITEPAKFGFGCEAVIPARTLCIARAPRPASDEARHQTPPREAMPQ